VRRRPAFTEGGLIQMRRGSDTPGQPQMRRGSDTPGQP